MSDLVDFSDYVDEDDVQQKTDTVTLYNGYTVNYDKRTYEYYRVLRMRLMDPILNLDLDTNTCFKFTEMWDPYTGERKGNDPNGPLCFHPDVLIKHFYTNRLNNLWVDESDEHGGYFQGRYDDAVGAGQDIFVQSRGHCPDKYLFRLPIIDCYLTSDHNNNIITMGPTLTDKEIAEIDRLAQLHGDSYKIKFNQNRPSLVQIKKLYDESVSKTPTTSPDINLSGKTPNDLKHTYYQFNCSFVQQLKLIKG
jgi:hypothetical protein